MTWPTINPPTPPPPPHRPRPALKALSTTLKVILSVAAVLLAGGLVLHFLAPAQVTISKAPVTAQQDTVVPPTAPPKVTPKPLPTTPKPLPPPAPATVGQELTFRDGLYGGIGVATVHSAIWTADLASVGEKYASPPAPGNAFLVLDVSVRSTQGKVYTNEWSWTVADKLGHHYDLSMAGFPEPQFAMLDLSAGQTNRGLIPFEAPANSITEIDLDVIGERLVWAVTG